MSHVRHYAILRGGILCTWLVKLATERSEMLATLPTSLVDSSTVDGLAIRLLGAPGLLCLRYGAAIGCVLLLVSARFAAVGAVGAAVGIVVTQYLARAVSFNNHAEIPMILAALLLCQYELCDKVRGERGTDVRAAHRLLIMAILYYWPYTMIGVHRLIFGLDWILSDGLQRTMIIRALEHRGMNWDGGLDVARSPFLFAMVTPVALLSTVVEAFSVLAVLSRWFRSFWTVWMLGFHMAITLTMDICFWENAVVGVLVWWAMPCWLAGRAKLALPSKSGPTL